MKPENVPRARESLEALRSKGVFQIDSAHMQVRTRTPT